MINIRVEDSQVQALLNRLSASVRNMSPALKEVGDALKTNIQLGFNAEKSPYGDAWAKLKPATLKARRKKGAGAKILRDTGRLVNSITRSADANSVTVGTNVPYAAIHQFGGTIDHAARSIRVRLRTVKGRTRFAKDSHKRARIIWGEAKAWFVNIPARPFMPIRAGKADLPTSWQNEIATILNRRIAEAVQ